MLGDLVGGAAQVHELARVVRDYWFALSEEEQFAKDPERDRDIAGRFGRLRDTVFAGRANGWRDEPETMLAAIILLDQFSRNIHRGRAEAFAADELAAELTLEAIERGYDRRLSKQQRVFLYMPLMHAEDASLQKLCVEQYQALGIDNNLNFAHDHRQVFERFGRFPGRNAALGRETTAEEAAWLEETDGGW